MADSGRCAFIKENGERCGSWPVKGDRFCINHSVDPQVLKIKAAAVRKGGHMGKRADGMTSWKDLPLANPTDVSKLLEMVINAVIRGDLSTNRASAVSSLCNAINRSLELGTLEDRLQALEKCFEEMRPSDH